MYKQSQVVQNRSWFFLQFVQYNRYNVEHDLKYDRFQYRNIFSFCPYTLHVEQSMAALTQISNPLNPTTLFENFALLWRVFHDLRPTTTVDAIGEFSGPRSTTNTAVTNQSHPLFYTYKSHTHLSLLSISSMALQLSLRRSHGLLTGSSSTKLFSTFRSGNVATVWNYHGAALSAAVAPQQLTVPTMSKRWATTTPMDLGDVIGIDLGTTNSCVAIMVR